MLKSFWTCQSFQLILKILSVRTIKYAAEILIFCQSEWHFVSQILRSDTFRHHCHWWEALVCKTGFRSLFTLYTLLTAWLDSRQFDLWYMSHQPSHYTVAHVMSPSTAANNSLQHRVAENLWVLLQPESLKIHRSNNILFKSDEIHSDIEINAHVKHWWFCFKMVNFRILRSQNH